MTTSSISSVVMANDNELLYDEIINSYLEEKEKKEERNDGLDNVEESNNLEELETEKESDIKLDKPKEENILKYEETEVGKLEENTLETLEQLEETTELSQEDINLSEEESTIWDGTSVDTSWYDNNIDETSYSIETAAQLAGIAKLVNEGTTDFSGKTIKLTADIDLDNKEWTPIGGAGTGTKFAGAFEGVGHTVTNLKISREILNAASNNRIGLFGHCTDNAVIQNLNFENINIKGCAYIGTVSGDGGNISNINVKNVNISGCQSMGSIAGNILKSISNCNISGNIYIIANKDAGGITSSNAGGILGKGTGSNINNCYLKGNINIFSENGTAGGIVGSGTNIIVSNCTVEGSVKITEDITNPYGYIGGILGKGYAKISNCDVIGDGKDTSIIEAKYTYSGGIVGFMGEGNCITEGCTVKNISVLGAYNGIGGINGILHYGNTISDCTVENVVVYQTTNPEECFGEERIFVGAFAGTYLDNSGKNIPTVSRCTFTGELYSDINNEKTNILTEDKYVGDLWYNANYPATVNIENCKINIPYKIIFNHNDGTDTITELKVNSENKIDTLPVPKRDGYKFKGWYTLAEGGEQITKDTVFENDTTVYAQWEVSSSSSSSSSSSNNNKTEIDKNKDGSTTITVTKPDGTITETTKKQDGSVITTITKPDGSKTETIEKEDGSTIITETTEESKITTEIDAAGNKTEIAEDKNSGSTTTTVNKADGTSSITKIDENGNIQIEVNVSKEAMENNAIVDLPISSINGTKDKSEAPIIKIDVEEKGVTKVEIPVENITDGTVAVIVKDDGTEEILKTSIVSENGVVFTVDGNATIKVIDNSKDFIDVPDGFWGDSAINFTTSREIFAGTSEVTFSPDDTMTRAMIITVLARSNGQDTLNGDYWYEQASIWAVENGISDGTNLENSVTREQIISMLYRYAKNPSVTGNLDNYIDVLDVSDYARNPMVWAVENGIIQGMDNETLNPKGEATRAQVATIIMNFIKAMHK